MDTVKLLRTRFVGPLFAVVLLLGLSGAVCAQDQTGHASAPASQAQSQQPSQDQSQKPADKDVHPTPATPTSPT
ncbi:MAG: hypothetical protein WBW91_16430, partial [Candidatus Sulfotelmatobacter sp.]